MKKLHGKRFTVLALAGCLAFSSVPVYAQDLSGGYAASQTQITGLTTEYLTNPIGIDTDSIHFGWKMSSNKIGAEQKAYRIQVYKKGQSQPVWNSGKVDGGNSVGIPYNGSEPIAEATAYTWEVTVWNEEGEEFQSETAGFETGVTNQQEWKDTEFIRMNKSARAPIFRTEQKLDGEVETARLYITAMGVYQAYVNGSQVGVKGEDGMEYHHMNPGYGNKKVSLGYQTYDVTDFLRGQESAALSVIAGNGWSDGLGTTSSQPAIKAMMMITYKDGSKKVIQTNTNDWRGTLDGPIVGNGIYYGEDYNAMVAEALGDFTEAGYDDSQWTNGEVKIKEPLIQNNFASQTAKYVRLQVSQTGPAVKEDNENRLQFMELELLDADGKNVAVNASAKASDQSVDIDQWNPGNLIDGDKGVDSDKGYTSGILAFGQNTAVLDSPITITLTFEQAISFQTLKLYPRIGKDPVSGKECVNYPKTYCLQVSEDGSTWKEVDLSGTAALEAKDGTDAAAETSNEVSVEAEEIVSGESGTSDFAQEVAGDPETEELTWEARAGELWYTVENLRNTVRFPADTETVIRSDFEKTIAAKDYRISVSEIGPAGADSETLLQIMELELLDENGNNLAAGVVPTASQNWTPNGQWDVSHLTDADKGVDTDSGYTSELLDKSGAASYKLDTPLILDFHFDREVVVSSMNVYPRTKQDSVLSGICSNYPKVYTVQTSLDGGETWENVLTDFDAGQVKNLAMDGTPVLSAATFSGVIRAQEGMPGRIVDQYSKTPVSVVTYTGQAQESSYDGGEIAVDQYIAYENSSDPLYSDKFVQAADENIFGETGITLKKGQTMIVNLGQNMTAIPEIEFSSSQGTTLTMKFAEMLNDGSASGNGATQADGPKGSMYQKSLRGARSAVKYTFAGNERERYQTTTSFFGYQYVGITATNDVTIYSLRSRALSSISDQTGFIETNNENVNKLFSNTLYGQMSNYFTTSTDCPQRDERLLWTGDTQAFAQTAVYNFNAVSFLDNLQDIFAENAWSKGYVPSVADDLSGFFSNWASGWSDVLVIDPWTLYLQTGDKEILEKNWDVMEHYMSYLQNQESKTRGANKAPVFVSNNYGDWLSFQGTCVEVISDYYYGYMARLMSKIGGILGNTEKETYYNEKFEAIKKTFLETHVTFEDGVLVIKSGTGNHDFQFMDWAGKGGKWEDNSQTALLWMLKLGFYSSDEMRDAAIKLLVANIKNENPEDGSIRKDMPKNSLAVGFLGSNVITPVLTDIGYGDVSYDLLLQDGQPSWLFEVKAGATTIWERWNSYTPGIGFGDSEMNSFNHYAYGSVVEWMYRYMAGISTDEKAPGFKNVVLQPTLDTGEKYNEEERIQSVDASYDSYYGKIASAWKSQDGRLASYHTVVPANTTATLYLPVEDGAVKDLKTVSGVDYKGMTEHNGMDAAEFTLQSGGYDFQVSQGKLVVNYAEGYTDGEEPQPLPTVKEVKVTPSQSSAEQGETLQFGALVTGENAPSQEVIWSVEGAASKTTNITETGLLTVGRDETAKALTVKAASAVNKEKVGTAIVTVIPGSVTPPAEVKVSSISVKAQTNRMFINDRTKVQAEVLPANAANKKVNWSSSDVSVASVDAQGNVTAQKAGSVTITALAADGSQAKGACTIKVVKPTVKLNVKTAKLQVKKSTKVIKASGLQNGDAVSKWTSSRKSVAIVDKKGKIKAKKAGTTRITVYTQKGAKASLKLTVTKKPVKTTSIKTNVKKVIIKKGKTYQLKVTRKPITATEKITYKTSKKSVAAVNSSGKIRAKKKGKAVITVRTSNGKKYTVRVTVK